MNEIEFRCWLTANNYKPKLISDAVSRLKRLIQMLGHIDLDSEYQSNHLAPLLDDFAKKPKAVTERNIAIRALKQPLTYKYALNLYIRFLESQK